VQRNNLDFMCVVERLTTDEHKTVAESFRGICKDIIASHRKWKQHPTRNLAHDSGDHRVSARHDLFDQSHEDDFSDKFCFTMTRLSGTIVLTVFLLIIISLGLSWLLIGSYCERECSNVHAHVHECANATLRSDQERASLDADFNSCEFRHRIATWSVLGLAGLVYLGYVAKSTSSAVLKRLLASWYWHDTEKVVSLVSEIRQSQPVFEWKVECFHMQDKRSSSSGIATLISPTLLGNHQAGQGPGQLERVVTYSKRLRGTIPCLDTSEPFLLHQNRGGAYEEEFSCSPYDNRGASLLTNLQLQTELSSRTGESDYKMKVLCLH